VSRRPIIARIQTEAPSDAFDVGLRDAFASWASGVAVVAVRSEPHVYAITATAVAPLSLEPPQILASVGRSATVLPFLEEGAAFTVSVLREDQQRLASVLSDAGPLVAAQFPPDGPPGPAGALAAFACTVAATHDGGDHRIVVGRIDAILPGESGWPLLYYRREYHRVARES
jgi:flavin reductase (NADH)